MRHIAFPRTPFLFTPRLTTQCRHFIFFAICKNYSTTAKISISTRTSRFACEVFLVYSVECSEISDICKEACCLYDIVKA